MNIQTKKVYSDNDQVSMEITMTLKEWKSLQSKLDTVLTHERYSHYSVYFTPPQSPAEQFIAGIGSCLRLYDQPSIITHERTAD